MRLINLESYPNREIRVTLVRSQVAAKFSYEDEKPSTKVLADPSSPTCHSRKTLKAPAKPRPLGTLELTGKPGWGGLPRYQRFSTYARRQILRAGGALEMFASHQDCLFLTLTLPGSTKVSMEALARFSGLAVQRLKAWIGWRIKENMSIYTWELQKRGALHLHYVVWCPNREVGEYIRQHLKEQWIRILDSISEASGVDMYQKHSGFSWASNKEIVRVDAQWCKKSVAAYLSKYVSKPNKFLGCGKEIAFCPSRWYGVSRPLLAKLREVSFRVSLDSLRDSDAWSIYTDCLSVLQQWGLKCYEYRHEVGDGKTIVGYVEKHEQDSIWKTIMTQISTTPDSSESTDRQLLRLIQNGVFLMRKHRSWHSTWNQFCQNSRPSHLISSPLSPSTTRADLAYLVDMLIYTYRHTERVQSELPGECNLWFTRITQYLHHIDPTGELGYRACIPLKVLLRLEEEKLTSANTSLR